MTKWVYFRGKNETIGTCFLTNIALNSHVRLDPFGPQPGVLLFVNELKAKACERKLHNIYSGRGVVDTRLSLVEYDEAILSRHRSRTSK